MPIIPGTCAAFGTLFMLKCRLESWGDQCCTAQFTPLHIQTFAETKWDEWWYHDKNDRHCVEGKKHAGAGMKKRARGNK